eukprot:CAMPEP_0181299434 /NCGR_PEP_ID=MMETSP1101-20121128/6343_1 /TAXON_ID=46948 /ORGANISM="Rhodomonas abbreviata, Strain Caron Lab Isolate" /LENGTH=203 /DNA_ID=CAMNT_0023404581 /DNA_START=111 /DNA_END=722 /DNA_ORIENTATION=-
MNEKPASPDVLFLGIASHFQGAFQDVSTAIDLCTKSSIEAITKTCVSTAFNAQNLLEHQFGSQASQQSRFLEFERDDTTEAASESVSESLASSEFERRGSDDSVLAERRRLRKQQRKQKAKDEYEEPKPWKPISHAEHFKQLVQVAHEGGAKAATIKRSREVTLDRLHGKEYRKDREAQTITVKRGFYSTSYLNGQYLCDHVL